MPTAVIVDAVRTPMGKRNGSLQGTHPVDLAAITLRELVNRNDLDPALVEDVIMGCVMQVGEQGINIARNVALTAGFPDTVPATSIDRQCGSSQQAAHFAAQGVMAGAYDVVIAAGVESMSRVPMGASIMGDWGSPFSDDLMTRYPDMVPQGISAELIAEKWGFSREDLDEFSVRSQTLAAQATDEGRFEREIVGVPVTTDDGDTTFSVDETFRRGTTVEKLAQLKPAFKEDGVITAGNSSQISDGAAAVLVMSEEKAAELGVTPRARFDSFAVAGADPVLMLTAPIPATTSVLERAGKSLDDIDLVEINEAFAPVVLAWAAEHHPHMDRVNPNGGAIALGHPLGCSGARLMTTLVNELERTGKRWGLQTMCEGGGMANATIIERL
ncbi:MAG: thiolase family protein [Acidimicrobiia bacterium]|nr:thiolase family protein [Acidimicrobiia bacterium]